MPTKIIPEALSSHYHVRRAAEEDIEALFTLYRSHRHYFDYFAIDATRERLREDMTMLPDGCREDQKHFLSYDDDVPVAILDLIEGYPTEGTCYIGLFMVTAERCDSGIGSGIISELCEALKERGFQAVRLTYGKRYDRAVHFWTKNGFVPVKEALHPVYGELIVAEREL